MVNEEQVSMSTREPMISSGGEMLSIFEIMQRFRNDGSCEHIISEALAAYAALAPQPVDAGEQVRLLLSERVAHAARQFCEDVQEDAEGVPQLQLANLNRALDAWEPSLELADGPYDDSQPALAALQSLVVDPHATDNQRRIAHLARQAIANHEEETDKELRRWQDAIRDKLIDLGAPDHLIDGAGCDSGDPLDFTLAEVGQGVGYFVDELDSKAAVVTQLVEAIEAEAARRAYSAGLGVSEWKAFLWAEANEALIAVEGAAQV